MKKHLSIFFMLLACTVAHAFSLTGLKTDYTVEPLGIDDASPRFSWQMVDTQRGAVQTAYQIKVVDEAGSEVWNSGKVKSGSSVGIAYEGQELKPRTRYSWTVTVWNGRKKPLSATASSWFETGLMTTSDKDAEWGGAQWIGATANDGRTFFSHYLPVFRINFTFQLDKKSHSTVVGFIYGGNDIRLMNRNKNILGVENGKNESYIKMVINTTRLAEGDSATLEFYRVGYTAGDKADKPIAVKKIPTSIINKANMFGKHSVTLASMHGTTDVWIDGMQHKVVGDLNLNPMGKGGDYISFPVVGDVALYVAEHQKATFTNATIGNYRDPFNTVSTIATDTTITAPMPLMPPKETGAPVLRTEFSTGDKPIMKARIYASARGVYDLYINGQRVGNDYLNPGLTQYNKTLFYQTFDVTPMVKSGLNALGAQLSEGWWSGACTFAGENWNFFGDRQSMIAELIVTYSDGSEARFVTNPSSWQYSTDGPVRIGSLFQGEVYDATRYQPDWASVGFNSMTWKKAEVVPLEGVISHSKAKSFFTWPTPDDYSSFKLMAQIGRPVRQFATLTAKRVDEVRPGVFVYDMGQNMAGVPEITFTGLKPGTKVYMRYAEVRYPDLPEYKDNVGMIMMENQRGAMEQDIYVARGGTETFHPRMTYHGYRYVEITGIEHAIDVNNVKGIVLSTIDELASDYMTDNPTLNRFFKNVEWSTLANVFSIPTDCPQRNERMGWSGDLSVFSPTMSYMFNGATFLSRHLLALRNTQLSNGDYPAIAPIGGGFGGPLWASVGITMPWQSYLQYGDTRALADHYDSMKRFISLYTNRYIDKKEHYFHFTDGIGLGDWLGFEVNKNDNTLLFDCYLVHELDIMTRVAHILGHDDDARRYEALRGDRARFINANYIDAATGITTGPGLGIDADNRSGNEPKAKGTTIDTQTSYALPIVFNIVGNEMMTKFAHNFENTITRQSRGDDGRLYPSFSLMTGFIGTAWIAQALTDVGRSDLAYKMLENRQFPSWLYPVDQGATTIWERLNSYTKKDGFGGNNHMNSFNHYAFGSVTNWLMQHSLGIARDVNQPAFKHFILQPEPDMAGGIKRASGHYDSMYGRISSSWLVDDDGVNYHFVIPANTSATISIRVDATAKGRIAGGLLLNGKRLSTKHLTEQDGRLVMELPSGDYRLEVKHRK